MQDAKKGEHQEKSLKSKQRELKNKLFTSIDKAVGNHFILNQSILQNRNQRGQELSIIDRQFSYYKKDLEELLTPFEMLLLKNQLYKRADLRCDFREKGGHLPSKKLEELYKLEVETSSDKGRAFLKVCQRLGIVKVSEKGSQQKRTEKDLSR